MAQQALPAAIFRNQRDAVAAGERGAGVLIEAGLPQSSSEPVAFAAPNSAWKSSRWPGPLQAADAENLAFAQREADA